MSSSIGLVESFAQFKEFKNIDRPTLMKVLEDVFKTLLRKNTAAMKILTLLSILIKATWKYGDDAKSLTTPI